jgi:hypothetical protein
MLFNGSIVLCKFGRHEMLSQRFIGRRLCR